MSCDAASETHRAELKPKVFRPYWQNVPGQKETHLFWEASSCPQGSWCREEAPWGRSRPAPAWFHGTSRVGAIHSHSPAPKFGCCLQCWVHPPGTAVTQKFSPTSWCWFVPPRGSISCATTDGEVLSLANRGILILFLELTSSIWIPAPKLCVQGSLSEKPFQSRKLLVVCTSLGNPVISFSWPAPDKDKDE